MSDFLILDWDEHSVRILSGEKTGGTLRPSEVAAASIERDPSATTIADALRPLVSRLGHGKSKVIVVRGGRDVQSRLLTVPPVPQEELADIVRLRASTEFPTSDDTATIDFLPLEPSEDQPSIVLAARISEQVLTDTREVCSKLNLLPQQILMRGCGLAELAASGASEVQHGVHLVVAVRGSELDLVGTKNGIAAVVRTVSLPSSNDRESCGKAAAREIKRTIAAVTTELNVKSIDSIVWMTGGDDDEQVAHTCGRELARRVVPVTVPLDSQESPLQLSAFAGMMGCGQGVASGSVLIDFLSPRKAPEKQTPVASYALAGILMLLLVIGGGWLGYSRVANIEKLAELDIQKRQGIERELDDLAPQLEQAAAIEQWLATDVNWLDEIDRIVLTIRPEPLDSHDDFEPDHDVLLTSVLAKQAPGRRGQGGTVELTGGVRDDGVLEGVEDQLRQPNRQVNPKLMIKDPEQSPYLWRFQDDIVVTLSEEERR